MKRFLSWVVLIVGYFLFYVLLYLCMGLYGYMMTLYDALSAFLKIMVIIIGGSFLLGLLIAPLWYGIPLVHGFSEAVCESRKGLRYTVFGIYICLSMVFLVFQEFSIERVFLMIFGIAMIVIGHNTRKEAKEKEIKMIEERREQ